MTSRPVPPQVRVATPPSEWERFVARSGLLTASALLVGILALVESRWRPSEAGSVLAGPELLLLFVVLGCVAVLSYRSDR